jgi:hypothetical protein
MIGIGIAIQQHLGDCCFFLMGKYANVDLVFPEEFEERMNEYLAQYLLGVKKADDNGSSALALEEMFNLFHLCLP